MKIAVVGLSYVGGAGPAWCCSNSPRAHSLASQCKFLNTANTAEKQLLPLQAVDVPDTHNDVLDIVEQFQYQSASTV